VLKDNLRETIRAINQSKLTTLAACGDVNRNVMCCPAPYRNPVYDQIQALAQQLAEHFRPQTTAYFDIWLTDQDGAKTNVAEPVIVDEPIYGELYLPRKFKMAIALPEENSVDVYAQDLGLLAIVKDDQVTGYNIIVGGGMGRTPSAEKTFAAIGQKMAFVRPDQVLAVAEAIVKVQRDFGNRRDRKVARMKYLVVDWGLERFKAKVEEYCGQRLPAPDAADVTGVEDLMGWHEQGDGKLFLGINIENGRIQDKKTLRLKTALHAIISTYRLDIRLTPLQSIIVCDIDRVDRDRINQVLSEHGVPSADELSLIRRYSIACPALPTCGLSITESERVLPQLIDQLDNMIAELSLEAHKIAIHMTGCPNGCTRPYTPDIGLVGRSAGRYTLFLGGNAEGTRLAFIYQDQVPFDEIAEALRPLLVAFRGGRGDTESFGNFCNRLGVEGLQRCAA
jgi:sulfite reductase (ferredoxin)